MTIHEEVGTPLGLALVRIGAIDENDLLKVLSEDLGLPILSRDGLPSPADVRAAAAETGTRVSWWITKEAAPWFTGEGEDRVFHCVSRHPLDPGLGDLVRAVSGAPVRFHLASGQTLETLLAELGETASSAALEDESRDAQRLRELAEEAPAIDFVGAVFAEALKRGASDVHIEPFEDQFVVRLRVDGVMTTWRSAPRSAFDAVASRLKLLSGMNIAERRLPQDGRQSIRISGRELDLRVSTLPATWGESIVLRLLGKTSALPEMTALGFSREQQDTMLRLVHNPHGIVAITGPTGSGKTTTIYRLLSHLNNGARKIITVEDPVEFDLPGVMQLQTKSEIGLTFASGLRSILRQDPDIIMVGEIRDTETAQIAVQAALTGHLVITTLHTNSALAAVPRLLDLGIESYLLADVLRGLAAQRLLRRLCSACAVPMPPSEAKEAEALFKKECGKPADEAHWRLPRGCDACGGTGYQGRAGVYEIAETSDALLTQIRDRATEHELSATATASGFRTLYQDGLIKARRGLTSLDEVARVLSS
ncbi:MAG: GspE/PulE family protein [Parvularcula sp.]|nr:GspE/PulE family protein [Parvularcula sp.]